MAAAAAGCGGQGSKAWDGESNVLGERSSTFVRVPGTCASAHYGESPGVRWEVDDEPREALGARESDAKGRARRLGGDVESDLCSV